MSPKRRGDERGETPVDVLMRAVAARRRAGGLPWPPIRNDGHSGSRAVNRAAEEDN